MIARPSSRTLAFLAFSFSVVLSPGGPARAWGSVGHHLISRAAAESLPPRLPDFVRAQDAILTIEALGTEADRSKGSGKEHDADRDPGHYVDLGDDGTIGGVVPLANLPGSRREYDTALRAAHTDQYAMGFVPYSIIDGWQQVRMDFAVWRTDTVGAAKAASAGDRAWFATDRMRRETIAIRDIGYWSHFVGDASQPLHVSNHYNGWGDFPNPEGFTQSKSTHAHFESDFVADNATLALVEKAMTPLAPCDCSVETHVSRYIAASNAEVLPLYRLEKRGAFASATPAGVAFMVARLADGASALRDFIVEAYDASGKTVVGYPDGHPVADYESGAAVPSRTEVGGS